MRKWREENISFQVKEFIREYPEKITYWDQDALIAVLHDRWKELAPKWNQQVSWFSRTSDSVPWTSDIFLEALRDPAIVHYAAWSKPWHYMNAHPFKRDYYTYLDKTEWKNFIPEGKTFKNRIKKGVKAILPDSIIRMAKRRIR